MKDINPNAKGLLAWQASPVGVVQMYMWSMALPKLKETLSLKRNSDGKEVN
jgi:hypothetical protein